VLFWGAAVEVEEEGVSLGREGGVQRRTTMRKTEITTTMAMAMATTAAEVIKKRRH
jgi:hypothetical protein